MRGGRSTSGACHAGRAMKAAPDQLKKQAERGGRKRGGGESERRAGRGTTSQPSAGGTAQSTVNQSSPMHATPRPACEGAPPLPVEGRSSLCSLRASDLPRLRLQGRSRSRKRPAVRPGGCANVRWIAVQGGRVLPSRSWSRGAEGSAAPTPFFWFPDYLGMPRGQWTKKHEQKVRIGMCPQVTETPTESVPWVPGVVS